MYRLKYNKVIFLVNISLHEYSSSFVFYTKLEEYSFNVTQRYYLAVSKTGIDILKKNLNQI